MADQVVIVLLLCLKVAGCIDASQGTNVTLSGNGTTPLPSGGDRSSSIVTGGVMTIATLVVGGIGVAGNSLVLLVLSALKQLRTKTTNKFILHQSFIDLMAATVLIFSTIFEDPNSVPGGKSMDIFCSVWLSRYFLWSFFYASAMNLVELTLEKYMSMFYPRAHDRVCCTLGLVCCFLFPWVFGLVWLSWMVVTTQMVDGKCSVLQVWSFNPKAFIVFNNLVILCAPVLVFIICHARIVHHVYNNHRASQENIDFLSKSPTVGMPLSQQTATERLSKAKISSIRTLMIVACGYLICWCPNIVYYTARQFGHPNTSLSSTGYHVTVILVFCNTIINPCIYAIQFYDFQQGVRQLLCRRCYRDEGQDLGIQLQG